jgi:hypothetical protein
MANRVQWSVVPEHVAPDGDRMIRNRVEEDCYHGNAGGLVGRARFELATNGLKVRCSNG